MPLDPNVDYEHLGPGDPKSFDETDINLRSYFCNQPDEKLAEYDPNWSDDDVLAWEENFRDDGTLMVVCCEREVEVPEYRRVLEEHLKHRKLEAAGA
jgi:hypothetical protein